MPRSSPFAFGFEAATLMTAPDQSVCCFGAEDESEQAITNRTAAAPPINVLQCMCVSR